MSALFDLEIITPETMVFTGSVSSLTCPGMSGRFQILMNHAPFITSLMVGEMHYVTEDGKTVSYSVSGGVTHVLKNKVMVLADTAERAEEINIERAQEAKLRAEERLTNPTPNTDVERARVSLLRAINRLKVAGGS